MYNPIDYRDDKDVDGNKQEAYEEYKDFLEQPNWEALFDEKTTHVGLECGCHASREEFCCFMYATNPEDNDKATPMDVIVVDQI